MLVVSIKTASPARSFNSEACCEQRLDQSKLSDSNDTVTVPSRAKDMPCKQAPEKEKKNHQKTASSFFFIIILFYYYYFFSPI